MPTRLEGRHGAAEPVGFARREAARHDGDLHGLFLEERHAEGLLQHLFEFGGRIGDRLQPLPPPQIGMHHVALDGAGPHDRDLDHEIVEGPGLQPRQHGHLGPALDLEHPDRVGPVDHVVDDRLLPRQGRQRIGGAVVPLEQVEPLLQAGQHAERQDVDLEDPERVEVVLVPFDRGAVRHGRVGDRHDLVEPRPGDDEAARMLRQVAREAREFIGEAQHRGEAAFRGIEADAARLGRVDAVRPIAPDGAVQGRDRVVRQAEGLADLADGRAGPIGDDAGREAGPLPPIAVVDILHHDLAPLVLEIDVDVGRLVAVLRDEALEQEVVHRGVDGRDAEHEAEHRIGGRAAPLAQDALGDGEAHDVVHREEIGRVAEARHDRELVVEGLPDFRLRPERVAGRDPLFGQGRQRVLLGGVALAQFVRVIVLQLRQRERDPVEEAEGFGKDSGCSAKMRAISVPSLRWRSALA